MPYINLENYWVSWLLNLDKISCPWTVIANTRIFNAENVKNWEEFPLFSIVGKLEILWQWNLKKVTQGLKTVQNILSIAVISSIFWTNPFLRNHFHISLLVLGAFKKIDNFYSLEQNIVDKLTKYENRFLYGILSQFANTQLS